MNRELEALVDALGRSTGKDVSLYDATFLEKSLEKRRLVSGRSSIRAQIDLLAADPTEAEAFCRSLNITYSEFFRTPLAFALLEALILPCLAQDIPMTGRPEIRVWSAGCAGGHEAYSIAILLDELGAAGNQAVPYRIFASDIIPSELDSARHGVYGTAEMQNVRLRHLYRYFVAQGDTFAIAARLRERVDFSPYDLLDAHSSCPEASIYGDFDLVFCSNLLFYYRPDVRQFILGKILNCLAPDGYLVTGEAERAIVERAGGFVAVAPPASVFQRARRGR